MTSHGAVLIVNLHQHSVEQIEKLMAGISDEKSLFLVMYSVGVEKHSRVIEAVQPYLLRNLENGGVQ